MKLELNNLSNWQDDRTALPVAAVPSCLSFRDDVHSPVTSTTWAREVVEWLMDDLQLRHPVVFYLQGRRTKLDVWGKPILGTEEQAAFGFDGDAYDNGVVRVALDASTEYPITWSTDNELVGNYLNEVIYLEDSNDSFIYMAAHELRHLWQWQHPREIRLICHLLQCDDEMDSDLYAARMLGKYKGQQQVTI
jgi:hypothetical protein